jgi:hypothetical protein
MRLRAALALALAAAPATVFAQTAPAPAERGPAPPAAAPSAPASSAAPAPASTPAPVPAAATPDGAEGAAALHATQELEARMLEMQRQLEAIERRQASWDDVRRRLDEIDARMQALSRELADTQAPPPAPAGPPQSSLLRFRDGALVFRSPGNAFLLRSTMLLQAGYEGAIASAGPADAAAPDRSSFSVLHAEAVLEGHAFLPRLEYRLQLDFAQPLLVEDAFVQWRLGRTVAVRVGQFKVPYGRQFLYETGGLEMPDLAEASNDFKLGWDLGVGVVGRPLGGRLQYSLAVLNGAGQGQPNDNTDLAYALRIVAAPFGPPPTTEGDEPGAERPLVAVGFSGFYNRVPTDVRARTGDPTANIDVDNDGRLDNVGVWQAGADVRAVYRGAAVQAEWFGRREQPGAAGGDRDYWGAYAQASYFVLPHRLQVIGRVGRSDLPLYGATLQQHLQRGSRVDEQSAGVSGYLHGHQAKLQVEYSHLAAFDATSAPDVHRVRAAVLLAF